MVAAALIARQGDRAFCEVSKVTLACDLPCAYRRQRQALSEGLRELTDAGILHIERRRGFMSRYSVTPSMQAQPRAENSTFADPEVAEALIRRRELLGQVAMLTRRLERIDSWLIYGDADRAGPSLDSRGRPMSDGEVKNS